MNVQQFLQQCTVNGQLDPDIMIFLHQVIISQDRMSPGFFSALMKNLQPLKEDERVQFLYCVQNYHNADNRDDLRKSTEHWARIGFLFEELEDSTLPVNCYKWIYAFDCFFNANQFDRLDELGTNARQSSRHLMVIEQMEVLGHLHYAMARHQLSQNNKDEALNLWRYAARERVRFFEAMKNNGYPHEILLAAAQQVWKMRGDFPSFFPDQRIEECGVTAETIAKLEQEFGSTVRLFSAMPS